MCCSEGVVMLFFAIILLSWWLRLLPGTGGRSGDTSAHMVPAGFSSLLHQQLFLLDSNSPWRGAFSAWEIQIPSWVSIDGYPCLTGTVQTGIVELVKPFRRDVKHLLRIEVQVIMDVSQRQMKYSSVFCKSTDRTALSPK